jgi:hypothetical protein
MKVIHCGVFVALIAIDSLFVNFCPAIEYYWNSMMSVEQLHHHLMCISYTGSYGCSASWEECAC